MTRELLVLDVQILLLQLLKEGGFFRDHGIKCRVLAKLLQLNDTAADLFLNFHACVLGHDEGVCKCEAR